MKRNLYGTHLPVLAVMASRVNAGEIVVEFGGGEFSTPLLRQFAEDRGFFVHTFESDPAWAEPDTEHGATHPLSAENLGQCLALVEQWRPALVLVDNGYLAPRETRRAEIVTQCLPWARWIVAHDTEPRGQHVYRYDFRQIPHQRHFWRHSVRTSLLSREPLSNRP